MRPWIVCVVCAALVFGACKSKTATEPDKSGGDSSGSVTSEQSAAEEAEDAAKLLAKVRADAAKTIEEGRDLNEKQYESLLLGLADCTVNEKTGYVDPKCEAHKLLKTARSRRNRSVPNLNMMWADFALRHLGHESAPVRIYSAQLAGSIFAATPESQEKVLTAARAEKDSAVLLAMIRSVRNATGKNPEVAKLMVEMSRHEDERVRKAVITAMTSAWAIGGEGTMERALEMIESDTSMEVRKVGCANLGARADDAALELLFKYTEYPSPVPGLYSDCMRGLVGMWLSAVPHKRPSQRAYERTIAIYSKKPRSKDEPAWGAISGLQWANNAKFRERATWFDAEGFDKLLVDLISDRGFTWLGRNSALSIYGRQGATAADLIAIRNGAYKGVEAQSEGEDAYIVRNLIERIDELERMEKAAAREAELEKKMKEKRAKEKK